MANNIERFNAPKSMQKRTLEEGIADYEEKKLEDVLEMNKKADEIIDSFCAEGLERGTNNPNFNLSEKLAQYPQETKNAIFARWLEREPREALWQMDEFGSLPSYFQKDIVEYVTSQETNELWFYFHILKVFDKITDRDLHQMIMNSDRIGLPTLAENKEKLPYISDDQILKRVEHGSANVYGSWYDWATVVPHVDKLPSVDIQQAIEGTLKQTTNSNVGVLIKHRKKLGLSEQELITIFNQHKKTYELLNNAEYIDPEYHQEIVDKYLEHTGVSYYHLWQNSNKLRNVDIKKIWRKRENDKNADRYGVRDIVDTFGDFQTEWLAEMPVEFVNRLRFDHPEVIARRADEFGKKIDREKLLNTLLEKEQFDVLITTAKKLGHERDETFANRIIDAGGASNVISRLNDFPRMSRQIYLRLVQEKPKAAIPKILQFDGITKDDVYEAVTTEGTEGGGYIDYIDEVLNNPVQIADLQLNQEFAEKLAQGAGYHSLFRNLEKFEGIDFVGLAEKFIADGQTAEIIRNVEKFPGLDHVWLAHEAIYSKEENARKELVFNFNRLQGLDETDIIRKLIGKQHNLAYLIAEKIDRFKRVADDRELGEILWRESLGADWAANIMARLNEMYSPSIDQTFTLAYDMLGDQLTPGAYNTVRALKDGSITKDELRALGVTKTGEIGINQLRQQLTKFKSEMLHPDFDASALEDSDFYRQYYKAYVRYTESEWGDQDEQSFEQIVRTYNRLKQEGRLRELPKEYVESGEVRVAKVDREKQEAFQYSEQFLSRFGALREYIAKALELLDQKRPLSHLVDKAETKRTGLLQTLKDKLAQTQHPKAIENLQKNIAMLEGLDLRSVKNFQKNFETLSQFSELYEELRQLVFYYALHKNRNYREPAKEVTYRDKPQFDDVRWMINFVDHIVNEETWAKYFTDDRASKSFRKLINVNALNEEFSRAQNQASSGTASMEFIPTRGLLMEFSGHIADACWASKYDSMAESFPNFSAVVLVQNRGTKHERLAGAGMLIETTAQDGTPLLVIRGLNPIENVINSLNVEDFYRKFTDYIAQIAEKTGRQLAIVIDDHSGGSASNRPALFELLSEKKIALQKVKLASEKDTTFNGYNIVDCTSVVSG